MMPEWGHIFHTSWVDGWFNAKTSTEINCPHCNRKLLTKEELAEKENMQKLLKDTENEEVKEVNNLEPDDNNFEVSFNLTLQ